jgi:hypothetical protein
MAYVPILSQTRLKMQAPSLSTLRQSPGDNIVPTGTRTVSRTTERMFPDGIDTINDKNEQFGTDCD